MSRTLSTPPRSDEPELMDGTAFDTAELAANFRDIQRVNRLLGGTSTILRHLPRLLDAIPPGRPATVLDLASGSADIPLAIAHWAERQGHALTIVASDVTPPILDLARRQVAGYPNISVAAYDARAVPLPDGHVDVVLCSLSLHHFAPDDAVRVLREMDRLARTGFILNDLRRSRPGYWAAWIASRLTTRNRLTRNDAPLSVCRAYTPDELRNLLARAGIDGAEITTHPWFRMAAVRTGASSTHRHSERSDESPREAHPEGRGRREAGPAQQALAPPLSECGPSSEDASHSLRMTEGARFRMVAIKPAARPA